MTIKHLVHRFDWLERDVEALSKILIILIALLFARVTFLIYEQKLSQLWELLAPMTSLVAALLVARVGSRLITNNDILREDDRRQDIVRITHHLIAIIQDLQSNVAYVKSLLTTNNRPVFVLREVATTIERRYETLLERDAYKYLPGAAIDLIAQMSGSIFGIRALAIGLEKATIDNLILSVDCVLPNDREVQIVAVDKLLEKITKLMEHIYEVRTSIELPRTKQ